jgi:hypothetical protein
MSYLFIKNLFHREKFVYFHKKIKKTIKKPQKKTFLVRFLGGFFGFFFGWVFLGGFFIANPAFYPCALEVKLNFDCLPGPQSRAGQDIYSLDQRRSSLPASCTPDCKG